MGCETLVSCKEALGETPWSPMITSKAGNEVQPDGHVTCLPLNQQMNLINIKNAFFKIYKFEDFLSTTLKFTGIWYLMSLQFGQQLHQC